MCLRTVSVRLVRSGRSRDADQEALRAFVAEVTDTDPALVGVDRRCPHCGAADHGRPEGVAGDLRVGVSIARTTGVAVLAVGPGALGVDVERPSRVAAAPLDVFTAGERRRAAAVRRCGIGGPDAVDEHLTACWAVKEAVLKRDGRGLRIDPLRVEAVLGTVGDTAVIGDDRARFDGSDQPVTVLRVDDYLVLAVAAGGLAVRVDDLRASGTSARCGVGPERP